MTSLAYDLHVLVRVLDRSAEVRLAPFGISYARYLALLITGRDEGQTQRELAAALGQSEANVSRTATALADAGWLEIRRTPGSGNRRTLHLTEEGATLLARASAALGSALDEVVRTTGRDPDALAADLRRVTALVEESP